MNILSAVFVNDLSLQLHAVGMDLESDRVAPNESDGCHPAVD